MYRKRKVIYACLPATCYSSFGFHAMAQLSLSGQLRTQTELRNGQGAPLPKNAPPASYSLTRQINFESGYGHFFTTALLTSPTVKNIPNAKPSADWTYIMVTVKPEFLFK